MLGGQYGNLPLLTKYSMGPDQYLHVFSPSNAKIAFLSADRVCLA